MKKNKGITLTSLVIYIALIFVVLAILMRITTYFSANVKEASDVIFETEFSKLNLYLLDEAKQTGNGIQEIIEDGTQITFSKGNKYTYNAEDKKMYLNNTIKICENVESCLFEEEIAENGKTILNLTIKINGIEKTVNYIITTDENENYIAEEDYIFDRGGYTEENLLPASYQQVEYIESTGTQYIDTGIVPDNNTSVELKLSLNGLHSDDRSNKGIFGTRTSATSNTFSLICGGSDYLYSGYGTINTATTLQLAKNTLYTIKKEKNTTIVNDTTITTASSQTFTSPYALVLFSVRNGNENPEFYSNMNLYYCKIWDGDTLVRNFIPCYRKADNVAGLYDLVNDEFYTNAGTGEFTAGSEVNN